ncbi:MAG: hypothetical protein IT578_03950 [Verrucomicrobiae bacterium]|nr:hypothetical protein [Verrucomicrobiae bacterium]
MSQSVLRIANHLDSWKTALCEIGAQPLALKPNFPEVAARWEAWWTRRNDRPLLVASAVKDTKIRWGKAFDLLEKPREWVEVRRRQVENLHWAGDAIPNVRVDLGPVSMAAYLGAPLSLSEEEQTTWQIPTIEDWAHPPSFRLDRGNRWFRAACELLKLLADDARGRYAVCLSDLTGAMDVLSNMRSPDRLCTDLLDHGAAVVSAAAQVVDAWEEVYATFYDIVLGARAGVVQWLLCWSATPYTVPTCDFNFMISPAQFAEFCLPSLRDQARRAGRCVLHVDGPGASRHAAALAKEPTITAIQYTPGAGTPSALAKLEMFKMLQAAGKPLIVFCPAEEVPELLRKLDPRGLCLAPEDVTSPAHADTLAAMCR